MCQNSRTFVWRLEKRDSYTQGQSKPPQRLTTGKTMSHTKGELTAKGDLVCDSSGNSLWDYHEKSPEENEANARRLVACWNAMDGIEDPEMWVAQMVYMDGDHSLLVNDVHDLYKERDELAMAATKLFDAVRDNASVPLDLVLELKDALDKVNPQPTKEPK